MLMKIFSLRNLIGIAAMGASYAYVRKQGGLKATFDKLASKKDAMLDAVPDHLGDLRNGTRDFAEKTL